MRRWTDEEIAYLETHYQNVPYSEIGEYLGRSEGSVRNKCHRLWGDSKSPYWTEDEIALLKEYYQADTLLLDKLSDKLGRHKTNVSRKAREFGLTAVENHQLTPKGRRAVSKKARRWIKENGHPKGFQGHRHTARAKRIISEKSKNMWADDDHVLNSEEHKQQLSDRLMKARRTMSNPYSRAKQGTREDLGIFVRSAWEANYARYLQWLKENDAIADWEYEPKVFEFTAIKRGTRSYTPDSKVTNLDGSVEWHEVKGWMDAKSKTRIKRFRKYFPEEKLVIIDEDFYRAIRNQCKYLVPNWE